MNYPQPFTSYEILERIGSGAMGTVFKAHHKSLDRIVAIKVLRPSLAHNQRYVERLGREARIVAALDHPNIVAGYDLGEEGGYHFFVMEFVDGRSLRQLLGEWGLFPEEQVLDVAVQVTSALDHAYRRGVIHRDIKPGNILIDGQNVVKLADMGLAKGPTDPTLTRDGATVGTPQYTSPEQMRDPAKADVRSDLYSVGATLYHMVTGSPPFRGDSIGQIITSVLHDRATPVGDVNPAVSDGLALVIRKLLAKDPELRYQTPAELLEDLRRVQRSETPAVDVRRIDRADGGGWSRRRIAAVAATAVLVPVVIIAALVWGGGGVGSGGDGSDRGAVAFAAAMELELAEAEGYRARVVVLRRREVEATSDAELDVVRAARREVDATMRRQLETLVARYSEGDRSGEARQWFRAPQNWGSPRRFDSRLEAALVAEFGAQTLELPAALRDAYRAAVDELYRQAEVWIRAGQDDYLASFEDYLRDDVTPAWTARLRQRDFAGADAVLRARLDAFFGEARSALPEQVRGAVVKREREAVAAAAVVIDAAERELADALRSQAQTALVDMRDKLKDRRLPAMRLRELLDRRRQDLVDLAPPAAFRVAASPWLAIGAELDSVASEIDVHVAVEEAAQLDRAVEWAYAALIVRGDPDSARAWIDHVAPTTERNRATRARHDSLLRGAAAAMDLLCGTVLAGRQEAVVRLRVAGGGGSPREWTVTATLDGFGFAPVGEGATTVPASRLHWPDLYEAAGGEALLRSRPASERLLLRQGLALWFHLSSDPLAVKLLDDDTRSFFANHVLTAVENTRRRQSDLDAPALAQLQELHRVFHTEPRRLPQVRAALAAVEAAGIGAAAAEGALLREVRAFIAAEDVRIGLEQNLRAAALPGTRVDVSEERVVTLVRDEQGELPAGWRSVDGVLHFEEHGVGLGRARREAALALGSDLSGVDRVEFDAMLIFPELPDEHRLYLFEVHGVLVVLGLLRDGTAAAVVLSPGVLDRPGEIARGLRAALEKAVAQGVPVARVLPGASHRLRVVTNVSRHRIDARVWLDDALLGSGGRRTASLTSRFRVMPMQPLQVTSLVVRCEL